MMHFSDKMSISSKYSNKVLNVVKKRVKQPSRGWRRKFN